MLMWFTSAALAIDIVTRKSSKTRAAGTITDVTKNEIIVKPKTGADIKIPVNDISLIEWDGQPSLLAIAVNLEMNGNYNKALDEYKKVNAEVDRSKTYLITEIEFFQARTLAKKGLAVPEDFENGLNELEKFLQANVTSYHYYEGLDLLGQLYRSKQDYIKANATYDRLAQAPFEEYQLSAKNSQALIEVAQGKYKNAITVFEEVLASNANDAGSLLRKQQALLGKATCLQKESQHAVALKLLEELNEKVEPDQSSMLAEISLRKGDSQAALGQKQEAILSYLLVDINYPMEKTLHPEALYQLVQLWPAVGFQGRAEEARATLETRYPGNSWTKKLAGGAN
jgi:tetratricopeptide (TPR) repeat protein